MAAPLQLRDMRFVLYEQLKAPEAVGLDEDTMDALIDAGATFAAEFLAPINAEGDRVGCTRHEDGTVTTPPGYRRALDRWREDGWGGMPHPEELGGQGLPQVLVSAMDEMVIGSCCAFHNYTGLTRACANMLVRRGSPEQIETWAKPLISAEWQGTMCLTEADAGSDVGASRTRAVPIEGDRYRIEGEKVFITSGEHDMAENIVHIVLARVDGDGPGVKGLSIFIVPKFRLDADGKPTIPNDVFCAGIEEKMGIHGSVTTTLKFGENGGCEGYLIGERKQGIQIMFDIMNEERIVVGQQGQALAATAYGLALKYAKERIQGSSIEKGKSITQEKVPIIVHPDVRRMLLTAKAQGEACRALLYKTGLVLDRERLAEGEERARHAALAAFLTPICKAYGSEVGFQACSTAMQVFGGYGYITEYGVEQLVRDARIACVYEGTNGIQAIDLLFRKVARDRGAVLQAVLGEIGSFVQERRGAAGGALDAELEVLAARAAQVGDVAQTLGGRIAQGDLAGAALGATPFLKLVGNLLGGYLLLEQAFIAEDELAGLGAPEASAERRAWAGEDEEKAFYAAKVETARFFVHQLLSENDWLAAQCSTADRSALDAALEPLS
ncbi:MAG: acyl-CoA dehydrogenase [Planctomycetota bacterium]|nr:MAG: acyl-CoA dehydrogenase [Planctomycetota bacterium]